MKKKIDFILYESERRKEIFRFYPRGTHVHGFSDSCPSEWKDVYKVYYSWAIIHQHLEKGEVTKSERIFYMPLDECSKLPDLSSIIKHVGNTGETYDYPTMGQPAADWIIRKKYPTLYEFYVFDNWRENGARFFLRNEKINEFIEYLDEINAYALAHSEEI